MDEKNMRAQRAMKGLRALDQMGTGLAAGGMGAEATERLADLDACTTVYRAWSPVLVPGLLQTERYAAEAIRSRTPSLPVSDVRDRTRSRVRRAEAFLERRAEPGRTSYAWFVIGEAAINRPLGSLHAHYEQLQHLLSVGLDNHRVIVQVLREDLPQPGAIEPFSIFTLDTGSIVAHMEVLVGGFYTNRAEHIARLHSTFSDVNMWSMSPQATRDYITEAAASCWDLISDQSSSSPPTPTRTTASTSPDPAPAPSA